MTPPRHDRPRGEPAVPHPLPRPLTPQECWTQLRRQHEGRLGYTSGRGPRSVVRPYALRERSVVLRLPADLDAARCAEGQEVAFEVQDRLDGSSVADVAVVGRARVVEAGDALSEDLPDEGWPDDLATRVLVVEVDDLRGTRRLVGSAPPAGGS